MLTLVRGSRPWLSRQRARLSGHGVQRDSDLVDAGSDVGGRSARLVTAVGVAGVGAGYGVAEVAFDPGEGRVARPVGADLLGGRPRKVLVDAGPEVVVAASGDRSAICVAQQLPVRRRVTVLGVVA